jgi:hypothetical protein
MHKFEISFILNHCQPAVLTASYDLVTDGGIVCKNYPDQSPIEFEVVVLTCTTTEKDFKAKEKEHEALAKKQLMDAYLKKCGDPLSNISNVLRYSEMKKLYEGGLKDFEENSKLLD